MASPFPSGRTSLPPGARRLMETPRAETAKAGIHFSGTEIASILISMLSIILAFHMFRIGNAGIIVGAVAGIIGHEIGHKIVAQCMGFESRYKLWGIGLVLVLAFALISRGRLIFAAPGFVHTEGHTTLRDEGIISLSAPSANIAIAAAFSAIGGAAATTAAYVNILLAGFNLLPIGPLDGARVMRWSPTVWGLALAATLGLGALLL